MKRTPTLDLSAEAGLYAKTVGDDGSTRRRLSCFRNPKTFENRLDPTSKV